jgi:hypothetical protein
VHANTSKIEIRALADSLEKFESSAGTLMSKIVIEIWPISI